jgi:pimeloyl-ACP methyl ester carboxylesterase
MLVRRGPSTGHGDPEFGRGTVTAASGGSDALAAIRGLSEPEVSSWVKELIATARLAPTGVELEDLFIASQIEGMLSADGIVHDVLTLREPWTIDLNAVVAPVTLFHAADDESCPVEGARFLARGLPRAELIEWSEGGHLATASHLPEVLRRVVA